MSTTTEQRFEDQIRRMMPVSTPPEQRTAIVELFKVLDEMAHSQAQPTPTCRLIGPHGERITVPPTVFYILEFIAEVLARGDSITVVPVGQVLTTQQAADLLNVSRQYLVRLLDEGRIPHKKTGKHRRVRIEDILAFKAQRDLKRQVALDELTQLG